MFKWPKTRTEYWRQKIADNVERDRKNIENLHRIGWRVAIVWECALRGKGRLPEQEVISQIESWLLSDNDAIEIVGNG
jgi:DNA mismatch endonuclease (patch repair protein)